MLHFCIHANIRYELCASRLLNCAAMRRNKSVACHCMLPTLGSTAIALLLAAAVMVEIPEQNCATPRCQRNGKLRSIHFATSRLLVVEPGNHSRVMKMHASCTMCMGRHACRGQKCCRHVQITSMLRKIDTISISKKGWLGRYPTSNGMQQYLLQRHAE